MATLTNFPFKNQRTTTLSNGSLDPNHDYDCVAESLAAGLQYLTGRTYEGGVLKEACYGAAYQGGTAASQYVDYCQQQGVKLYPIQGDNATLVQLAHTHIQQGHPVVYTEPDPYIDLTTHPGFTHVCVFYAETPSTLIAMDPFGGFSVELSNTMWQATLVDGEIWIMERLDDTAAPQEEIPLIIDLTNPTVARYYAITTGNNWHCKVPGHDYTIGGAILAFYRAFGGTDLCGLTWLGLPDSNEVGVAGHPGTTQQDFERATLRYEPATTNRLDNPPGLSGTVYLIHKDIPQAPAQPDPLLASLKSTMHSIYLAASAYEPKTK